jgi:hypothetical protein
MNVKNTDADPAVGAGGADDADVRVSSPAATGGAGTVFEHHVGAYWLAQLLVSGIPPILIDTTVSEVSFQTERLGWNTDDFLIVCERTGAEAQRLAGQVKRSFTVSTADEDCVKTVTDFWRDFIGPQFKPGGRLVLVTQRGTNTLPCCYVRCLKLRACVRSAFGDVTLEIEQQSHPWVALNRVIRALA